MKNLQILMILIFCLVMSLPADAQPLPVSDTSENDSIKIGLLITESPAINPLMQEAIDVVNLLVDQSNDSGGIEGKKIQLFVESVDGNWGTGSKRAVDLIFGNGTTALLGFVDGRSAHLIEQICTKAQIPFISTFSPDPTLSRINIPWFFSTLPHAGQQANILAEYLFKNNMGKSILVVTSDDYDQGFISRSFIEEMANEYHYELNVLTHPAGEDDYSQTAADISESAADAIAFFGAPGELEKLRNELEMSRIEIPVYTSIHDLKSGRSKRASNPVFAIRSENLNEEKEIPFQELFYEKYEYKPGIHVSYLYDGIQALLKAIGDNGSESYQIQKTLAGMNGLFSFDSDGVIKQSLTVVQISGEKGK